MVLVQIDLNARQIQELIFALEYKKISPTEKLLDRWRWFMVKELLPMWLKRAKAEEGGTRND